VKTAQNKWERHKSQIRYFLFLSLTLDCRLELQHQVLKYVVANGPAPRSIDMNAAGCTHLTGSIGLHIWDSPPKCVRQSVFFLFQLRT